MAERVAKTPTPYRAAPTLADILVRQPRAQGLEFLTPFEVDTEAWRLGVLGWSMWRIQAAMGFDSLEATIDALERYRASNVLTDDMKTAIMVGQLDDAIHDVIAVRNATHYKFHKGDLIMMAPDPAQPRELVPVVDTGPTLDAAKTLAMLLDRKAKLLGLDAPEKHEHRLIPLPTVATDWVAQRRAQVIEGTST
jgi:hypothetical protein